MKFDLHNHHYRCGHAEGNIEDYIKAAIERGLNYIGIADHSPYFYSEQDQLHPGVAMAKSEMPNYINEVLQLKQKYEDKIHVLLGMESDYFPEHEALYRKIYQQHPFDYVIGSVHHVNGKNIFERGRWDGLNEKEKVAEKERYYKLIQQSAKSGIFQILGHIDAMKGFYPAFSDIDAPIIEDTLKVIAETGVAIEVNTSGDTKDCGGWYPSHEILERACHYGVNITFGSDAHVPARIGDDFELVQQTLREMGSKSMVYFVDKQMKKVNL